MLIEVTGRPVFVLPGAIPAYRDPRPGAEGADVAQAQRALRGLGLRTGSDRDGAFGAGTKAAVAAFHGSIGYAAPTTGDEAEVAAAGDAVKAADRGLARAERDLLRLERAGAGADETAVEDARHQVRLAEEDLADARRAHEAAARPSGAPLPLGGLVFVPEVPALVHELKVGVGQEVVNGAVTLSTNKPAIDGGRRELLKEAMAVEVFAERRDLRAAGRISAIGEFGDDEERGLGLPHELAGEADRSALRGARIGFVFQSFHLLAHCTATENVAMGLLYAGIRGRERTARARAALAHRADAPPSRLSGGSASGSPSPARWYTDPPCCSATSRPATSTPLPPTPSWT